MENIIIGKSLVIEGEIIEIRNYNTPQKYKICIKTKEGVLVSFEVSKDILAYYFGVSATEDLLSGEASTVSNSENEFTD